MHPKHGEICTTIDNRGTFYTVPLRFGSEQEKVDLIVDTGSNVLVVSECKCKTCHVKKGHCVDASESSSYKLNCYEDGEGESHPVKMIVAYASGNIIGYVSDDTVRVGGFEKEVKMMLVREAKLDFSTAFQGIIGLGLPTNKTWFLETLAQSEARAEAAAAARGEKVGDDEEVKAKVAGVHPKSHAMHLGNTTCGTTFSHTAEDIDTVKMLEYGEADSLLEQLGAKRFSMCFIANEPGVLRINQAKASPDATLAAIGTEHWGLGLAGVSLDGEPVGTLCTEKKEGMATPCGFIPDSGTTMITMPKAHFFAVKASLCQKWELCARASEEAVKEYPGMEPEYVQASVFDKLIFACEETLGDADSLDDVLPSIELTATDKGGKTLKLKLSPYSWIVSMKMIDPLTGLKMSVCQVMFEEMEYETEKNGPIWIVGTPIFHQFTVGFEYDVENPKMSFKSQDDEPCGKCGAALTAQGAEAKQRQRIRAQTGTPLRPRIDTSRPL